MTERAGEADAAAGTSALSAALGARATEASRAEMEVHDMPVSALATAYAEATLLPMATM